MLEQITSFQIDYIPDCSITKWKSKRTGLQLVHINQKSTPLVQGYFALATECITDSGAPHTLEHLIFMGSERYPYKGLLDTAGNLCMSSTNAWTATDHTCYSLVTAGWHGFAKLLPVYLDHILFPTLTDAACVTEVYHIDPEDLTDKGVVYSEMDAIESQSWFVTNHNMQRLLFPEESGYRSETGGLTKQLRKLTNEQIKEFHKLMYTSDNLCLIITGNVPTDELLTMINEWDSQLPEKNPTERYRPFVDNKYSQIPKISHDEKLVNVEFPELDETQGEILLSWYGESYQNTLNDLAITLLMEYFTETALAPFVKQLVEIDDPLSTSVDFWTDDYLRTIINVSLHGVPAGRLMEAKDSLLEILSNHTIDLTRMKQVIDNSKWDYIIRNEKGVESTLVTTCITDFLYGDDKGQSLANSLKDLSDYDKLTNWSQEQWQSLLKDFFIDNKPAVVLGKPSAQLYKKIDEENEELLKTRKASIDQTERQHLEYVLNNARIANGKLIPKELLAHFEINDPVKTVDFIKTKSITPLNDYKLNDLNDTLTKTLLDSKPKNFPFFIHLEQFPAQFIEIHCLLNSTAIKDVALLPYYHIFDRLFSMPMKLENGDILPYEEVVSNLKSETVDSQITLGIKGTFPDLFDIRIRCKSGDYEKAVRWIKHCLFDMVFDEKRVAVLLENYYNSIVELKREGDIMLESLTSRTLYTERSIKKSIDPLFVENEIAQILDDIEDHKFETNILPKLEIMRNELKQQFNKFHLLILGDLEKIKDDIYTAWNPLINAMTNELTNVTVTVPYSPKPLDFISQICKAPKRQAFVITTPGSESSYMNTFTPVPFDMNYEHRDYAAVSLAAEYLQCVEGPFWKGIRGAGLAYGANMIKKIEINSWCFNIFRGADIVKCYETAKLIVEDFANGQQLFDEQMIKASISSIINTIASIESGYFDAGISNFVDRFILDRGANFTESYLERLGAVTAEDLQRVMKKYLINLFDSEKSVVFISCHPSKFETIQEFLESNGFDVKVEELEIDDDEEDEEDEDNKEA